MDSLQHTCCHKAHNNCSITECRDDWMNWRHTKLHQYRLFYSVGCLSILHVCLYLSDIFLLPQCSQFLSTTNCPWLDCLGWTNEERHANCPLKLYSRPELKQYQFYRTRKLVLYYMGQVLILQLLNDSHWLE